MFFIFYRFSNCLVLQNKIFSDYFNFLWGTNNIIIPNQVDINSKVKILKKNNNVFIYAGRFEKKKNLFFLIKVFYFFQKKKPNFKLLLVGSGSLKMNLIKLVNQKKIQDKVTFIDKTKNLEKYYKKSNYAIQVSKYEGLSNFLLESMYFGVPCIIKKFNYMPNFFNIRNSLIIDHADPELFANKICDLINNKAKIKKITKKAKDNIRKLNKSLIYQKWEKLFKTII